MPTAAAWDVTSSVDPGWTDALKHNFVHVSTTCSPDQGNTGISEMAVFLVSKRRMSRFPLGFFSIPRKRGIAFSGSMRSLLVFT